MNRPFRGAIPALLLALAVPAAAEETGPDLSEWIDGPVRYIVSRAEERRFRALSTDEERALFIERFWAARDPDPETLPNPYRKLFWERVATARERFLDSSRPGWMTDRGKIFILYGPPTDIQEELHLQVEEGTGVIRWIYEGRPAGRMDLDPTVIVPFVRDGSGEYRVSYDPKLSSPFFQPQLIREGWNEKYLSWIESVSTPFRSRLSVMLDLGKMQEVPPEAQVLLERVETLETFRTDRLPTVVQRVRPPDAGQPMLILTAELGPKPERGEPTLVARLLPAGRPEGEPRILGDDSFRVLELDGGTQRVAQARISLDPGDWDLTVMVADPGRGRTGIHRSTISVPDAPRTLTLGDVVFARSIEPVPYRSLVTYDEPYYFGPYRVVPRVGETFERGAPVPLVYEIYGGEPPFRIAYQLEGLESDGTWVPLGSPSTDTRPTRPQAWELPTGPTWPLGRYRIAIEVRDAEDRLVSRTLELELVDPPPAAPAAAENGAGQPAERPEAASR